MKKFTLIISMMLVLAVASSVGVSAADMYVEAELTPIVSVEAPTGGGNKDITIIQDGVTEGGSAEQYDTYCGRAGAGEDFVGYTFSKPYTVKEFVFTEGNHFWDGGWFEMGMVRIEALIGGEWQEVEYTSDPEYPIGLTVDEYGDGFETYTFSFDPIECEGIRIAGMAGGAASFISVAEVKVLAEVPDDYVVTDLRALAKAEEERLAAEANAARIAAEVEEGYINGLFVPFTNITEVAGGGNPDINVINDGAWNVDGDGNSALQFDTYHKATEYHDVIFGYEFGDKTCSVTQVEYYEGRQFADGGWFSNGLKVQALVGAEWVDVVASCTPEYPVSDVAEEHLPEAQCFTFTFDAVDCAGIRIIGQCSGTGFFTSISELRVKGAVSEAAAEAPVEETEAPAEETEAPVEETEAPVEETEAPAEEVVEAPQTFDAGIFAAVFAILSSAGYMLFGKRR